MGLSGGDGFYRGRPMDGSHAFTSKQGQAFLTPGRSRWPMMVASGYSRRRLLRRAAMLHFWAPVRVSAGMPRASRPPS